MTMLVARSDPEVGLRGWVRRRPLAAFAIWTFGLGWPLAAVPALVEHGLLAGPRLPLPVVVLALTFGIMLPAALVVTAVCDGRDGVRRLLGRVVQWRLERGRFGWRSWLLALVALPALTLLLGAVMGGTVTVDPGQLVGDLGSVASALILIHLAEETVWAGFVQSRMARRTGVIRAALITAVPFAAIHLPLTMIGPVAARSVLLDAGGLLLLAVVLRLMVGVLLDRTSGSILAAAAAHATFNAANNSGGLVDDLLSGVDQGLVAPAAGLLLVAALLLSKTNHTKG